MNFYPLPQGAADLTAAHEASATVLQGAAAVYDAVQEEAAAHVSYLSSLTGAVRNAIGSAAKKAANKALAPYYKAKDAVDDTAASVGMTFGPVATQAGGATMPAGATGPGYSGAAPGYQPGAVGATYVPAGPSGPAVLQPGLQYVGPPFGPLPPQQVVGGPDFVLEPGPPQGEIPVPFPPEAPPQPAVPPLQQPPPVCPAPVVQCPAPQVVMPPIPAPQCPPPQVLVLPPIQGGGSPPAPSTGVPGQPPPIVIPPVQVTQTVTIPPGPLPISAPPVSVTINLPPEPQQPAPPPVLTSHDGSVTYNQVSYAPVSWVDSHNQASAAYVAVYAPTSSVVSDESSVYQNTELSLTSQQSTILQNLSNTAQTLSQQWSQQVSTSQQISTVVGTAMPQPAVAAEAAERECPPPTIVCNADILNELFWEEAKKRNIAVDPFVDEILAGKVPGGCKPFKTMVLPYPADPQFCDKMIPIVDALRTLGEWLLEKDLEPFPDEELTNDFFGWAKRIINFLLKWAGFLLRVVAKMKWGARVAWRNCDWCALAGLDLVQAIWDLLRDTKLGFSLIIKLEVVLDFDSISVDNVFRHIREYICPDKIWALGDVIHADVNGASWGEDLRQCFYRQQGVDPKWWEEIIEGHGQHMTLREHTMAQRLAAETATFDDFRLESWGLRNPTDRAVFKRLYDRPPTPSECILWATNNVSLADFNAEYGISAEFDQRCWTLYHEALHAQGITKDQAYAMYLGSVPLPGVGEMATAVHRLRPGHVDPALVFTTADFAAHLAAKGVPPYWRARLQELVYQPLTRREVGHFVQYRVVTHDVLVDIVRDWGQDPTWAETILRPMELQGVTARLHATGALSLPEMGHMGALGMLSAQQLVAQYAEQGYQQQDAARATEASDLRLLATGYTAMAHRAAIEPMTGVLDGLRVGVVDRATALTQLAAMGLRPAYASALVNAEAWRAYLERVRRVEGSIHAAYRTGKLDAPTAVARMQDAGFTAEYTASVMPLWELDKVMADRQLTEAQIVRLYKDGIMPHNQALGRLTNLGWRTQDAQYLLADEAQKKAIADAKKDKVKTVKPKPQKRIGKADVHTLFKHGLLTEQQSRNILAFYGYPEPIVNLFIADWCGPGAGKEGPPEGCAQQNPAIE